MLRWAMQRFAPAAAWEPVEKHRSRQDPSFGHPEKFCSDIEKTNWESATVTTSG